jgi:hypothetical protein
LSSGRSVWGGAKIRREVAGKRRLWDRHRLGWRLTAKVAKVHAIWASFIARVWGSGCFCEVWEGVAHKRMEIVENGERRV